MTDRRVIDCKALMEQAYGTPGLLRLVYQWCRSNGIEPRDVPVHSEMVIEDSAFGLVIRYEAYLTNEEGRRYVDPDHVDQAAMAARTAVLLVAPPNDWLTGGETR
ncbi:hypothetical protein [Streptomyces sp. NPDC059759]|uniref:hypothetical protein n=1 Tax=Streptomyces sp. NPDC059759 TaxID=3346936 RepID=UPI00364DDFBD